MREKYQKKCSPGRRRQELVFLLHSQLLYKRSCFFGQLDFITSHLICDGQNNKTQSMRFKKFYTKCIWYVCRIIRKLKFQLNYYYVLVHVCVYVCSYEYPRIYLKFSLISIYCICIHVVGKSRSYIHKHPMIHYICSFSLDEEM